MEKILEKFYKKPLRIQTEIMGIPMITKTVPIPVVKQVSRVHSNEARDPIVQKAIEIFGATNIESKTRSRIQEESKENES